MSTQKATHNLDRQAKKLNDSNDYFFYLAVSWKKMKKVSPSMVCKRPIYKFFWDSNRQYFPLRCMQDLGWTPFVIPSEEATGFQILVAFRCTKTMKSSDVTGTDIQTEGQCTMPLGSVFGNHRSDDEKDHALRLMKTSGHYDTLIPAWYWETHRA